MQLVISAFPACGKSTICKNAEAMGLKQGHVHFDEYTREYEISLLNDPGVPVFDSDSSVFDKEHFPGNYIKHIQEVLEKFPDVVIMVSSHDNVRKAMADAGIPYTLVYPQLELKGEYMERYEKRGSSEAFIKMMDHKWNDFVDSSEADPTPNHIVLGEGEYLIDRVYDQIDQVVTEATGESIPKVDGFENMNDGYWEKLPKSEIIPGFAAAVDVIANATPISPPPGVEVTAAIVDVNADANNPDVIQPEPTGGIDVGVISVPEGTAASTLEGGPFVGTQPAVDASTVDDSALAGNEDLERADAKQVWADGSPIQDRSDLIEAKLEMRDDIEILEEVLVHCSEPDRGGLETLQDGGAVFQAASYDIKERYDIDVEPTLAGMESFLDTLKKVFTKTDAKLKEVPTKQEQAIIKKYLFENEKAANFYTDAKWQDEQKFINVGKTKIQVPGFLSSVDSPAAAKAILDMVNQRVKTSFTKYYKNSEARTAAGIKIFNALKGKSPEEGIGLADAMLPIKPEELTGAVSESGLKDLNVKPQSVELPVLNKDKIKEVVDIMNSITDIVVFFTRTEESGFDVFLDDEDWNKSKYWDKFDSTKQATQVWNVVSFYGDTPEFEYLTSAYSDKMLVVAKFLEQWILNSVK